MDKRVVYSGQDPARSVKLPGGKLIRAEKDKPVDVPAKVADSLVRQEDWAYARKAKKTESAEPAKEE